MSVFRVFQMVYASLSNNIICLQVDLNASAIILKNLVFLGLFKKWGISEKLLWLQIVINPHKKSSNQPKKYSNSNRTKRPCNLKTSLSIETTAMDRWIEFKILRICHSKINCSRLRVGRNNCSRSKSAQHSRDTMKIMDTACVIQSNLLF